MKNASCLEPKDDARRRGVALVIVLGFLVLVTVLIVAYFTSVSTESAAAKTYTNGAATKFLADSAVNIVMGQIAQATQGSNGTNHLTWASQPGMVRTFNDSSNPVGSGLGNLDACYKLYSASQMVIPGLTVQSSNTAVLQAMQNDVPMGWNTAPALYTDLNAPVTDASGALNFPILDGHLTSYSVSGSNVWTYRTANGNPNGTSTPDIEGFSIAKGGILNYTGGTPSATSNPAPMPVQWLYVLKNGSIISPDQATSGGSVTSGSTVTFNNATTIPTTSNPITGRIAFWTDDETCKLNINTASEGTFYDMPRANTNTEMQSTVKTSGTFGFAMSPPVTGEFNRYPGHPATTCLSVALGSWFDQRTTYPPNAYTSATNDGTYVADLTNNYLAMVPRTGTGGSLAGTVSPVMPVGSGNFVPILTALNTPPNRLYDSFDEVMFTGTTAPRTPNLTAANPGILTKAELEESKFFLTANSRAPELTPFNTPKVSLWPQWSGRADRQNYQGPQEQLLAFCSSFGPPGVNPSSVSTKFEYFWEWGTSNVQNYTGAYGGRYNFNAYSSNWDWIGANGSSTNGSMRNQSIANYLCTLGNQPIPGYGAAFRSSNKYSNLCFSNIIVDCLDYIRSCVDRADYISPAGITTGTTTMGTTSTGYSNDAFGVLVPPLLVTNNLPGVTPSTQVKGFGYTPVFSKVALAANLYTPTPTSTTSTNAVTGVVITTSTSNSYYVPVITFEGYIPTWSFPNGQPGVNITLNWNSLRNLGISTSDTPPQNGQWPVGVSNTVSAGGPYGYYYGRNLPFRPYSATLWDWRFTSSGTLTTVTSVSGTTSTTSTSGNLSTSITLGGSAPLQFSFPDSSGTTYQTVSVTFRPRVNIPIPANPIGTPFSSLSRSYDCNASTVADGDYRILGGTVNIASDPSPSGSGTTGKLYQQCAGYGGITYSTGTAPNVNSEDLYCRSTTQVAGVLTGTIAGTLAPFLSASGQPILSSSDYGNESAPMVPVGVQGAVNINGRPGDWDTGAGVFPDGPWVNARDQGDTCCNYGGPFAAYWPSGASWGGQTVCFTPNKRIASAIQFGSIPTGIYGTFNGVQTVRPWETLLFCPNPPARQNSNFPPGSNTLQDSDHIGFVNPPDHMLADFFTMPVVQPYAISEPLSTAGKVNLNYQIAPFTYIERSTALRGVLKNTLMMGISGHDVQVSQSSPNTPTYKSDATYPYELRYDINRDATIAGIEKYYFDQGQIFRYPSEICDVFLVPSVLGWYPGAIQKNLTAYSHYNPANSISSLSTLTYDTMLGWWNPTTSPNDALATMCMTGENMREEPYNHLYPRVTTQSNTFTVHCRVQVLQKAVISQPTVWTEGQDIVSSEYRGSSLIERYIDPNDPNLNSTWDSNTMSLTEPVGTPAATVQAGTSCDLSTLYKFRVLSTKKFAP